MKKIIMILVPASLIGGCGFVHRNLISAWWNGDAKPLAPKWHIWVKPEKRRS